MTEDKRDNWVNERMKSLLINDEDDGQYTRANAALEANYCPTCKKHKDMHNDEKCNMRFEEAELCLQAAASGAR